MNSPFLFGSPARTASFAPGRNPGGASPYFKSPGLRTTCCSLVADSVEFLEASFFCAATATRETAKGRVSINAIFFIIFRFGSITDSNFLHGRNSVERFASAATVLPRIIAGDFSPIATLLRHQRVSSLQPLTSVWPQPRFLPDARPKTSPGSATSRETGVEARRGRVG